MKPIIVDMNDMSDSTEVYESRPNRFLIYTIYLILFIFLFAILWMSLSKIDIVVKSNGIFKGSNAVYEISSGVTGSVKENYIENGQYVKEGDILYVLTIDELSDTIIRYQNELDAAKERLVILSAYEKSLDGDKNELESLTDNSYYKEFENRRELLYANVNLNDSDTEGQAGLYKENVDSISRSIAQYNEKINKLNIVKQCIVARDNIFDTSESVYYSMVNSYLASYSYTDLQYNNQINEYEQQINDYDEQINKAEEVFENRSVEAEETDESDENEEADESIKADEVLKDDEIITTEEMANNNDLTIETLPEVISSETTTVNVEILIKQRDALISTRDSVQKEKMQALKNLELQQITTIEQQITALYDSIQSLETNLTSAKLQLNSVNNIDYDVKESIAILTEKGSISTEIMNYEDKVKECETYLKSYDIQNNNCFIKANVSGYLYTTQDLKIGSFVQEGTAIGAIYPETESKYYAEIYVENSDIAKIKVGQEVKFEIAAYPSSEYGYFKGNVENIAKDISMDQSTGYAYYLVRVRCENMTLQGKNGEEANLMNGMACQAKIVTDEENVLFFLLKKIDLID